MNPAIKHAIKERHRHSISNNLKRSVEYTDRLAIFCIDNKWYGGYFSQGEFTQLELKPLPEEEIIGISKLGIEAKVDIPNLTGKMTLAGLIEIYHAFSSSIPSQGSNISPLYIANVNIAPTQVYMCSAKISCRGIFVRRADLPGLDSWYHDHDTYPIERQEGKFHYSLK